MPYLLFQTLVHKHLLLSPLHDDVQVVGWYDWSRYSMAFSRAEEHGIPRMKDLQKSMVSVQAVGVPAAVAAAAAGHLWRKAASAEWRQLPLER